MLDVFHLVKDVVDGYAGVEGRIKAADEACGAHVIFDVGDWGVLVFLLV